MKYNLSDRITDLNIVNVGSANTDITVSYYGDDGSYKGYLSCPNQAPTTQCIVTLTNGNWGSLLNARITASQPLAAVAVERNSNQTQVSTHNLLASAGAILYAPVIKKDLNNQSTGLRIQNTSQSSSAIVVVTYYDSSTSYTSYPPSIPPKGAYTLFRDPVLPSSFLGSARIVSTQPIVAQVHEAGPVRKMSSSVFVETNSKVSYAVRACNPCAGGFYSGIRVQNIGSVPASVTIQYYNSMGQPQGTPETITNLGAYRATNASNVPAGLSGSAVLMATQLIVVVVNLANPDTNQDLTMTYNAPNR